VVLAIAYKMHKTFITIASRNDRHWSVRWWLAAPSLCFIDTLSAENVVSLLLIVIVYL